MATYNEVPNGSVEGHCGVGRVASAVVLVLGLMTTGCAMFVLGAAAGAGAAGVAYAKGDLQARVKADPRAVEKASVKAFEALGVRTVSSVGTGVDAQVIGRTASDTKITIKAESRAPGDSLLSIRIGAFGDEAMSRRIHDEIKKHLPAAIRALEAEADN